MLEVGHSSQLDSPSEVNSEGKPSKEEQLKKELSELEEFASEIGKTLGWKSIAYSAFSGAKTSTATSVTVKAGTRAVHRSGSLSETLSRLS